MLLLTGATGLVGRALLRRLTAAGGPVRCLVRDPRRLGADRVRVQIALGDLADPPSFRNAMRGVKTVVHLATAIRDQPAGSIEELNGIATWRMVQAAERAGVEHFVFMSSLGAVRHDRTRYLRAKALAESAVLASDVRHTVLAPSFVYAPGDPFLTMVERAGMLLPVVPISGRGHGAVPADLGRRRGRRDRRRARRRRGRRSPLRAGRARDAVAPARSSSSSCAPPAARGRSSTCRRRSSAAACACSRRSCSRARRRRGTRPSCSRCR